LAVFDVFFFYDWPFLHVYMHKKVLFSSIIFDSVFSDFVAFYGDQYSRCQ